MRLWLGVGVAALAACAATSALGGSGSGTITTFAGIPGMRVIGGFSGDGGPATRARLNRPEGVAVDRKGNVYIADTANSRIRKVSPGGRITTFAGTGESGCGARGPGDGGPATSAPLCITEVVAVDGRGNVYFDDSNRVRRVDPSGTITTFAGTGTCCAQGDGGPATSAWFFGSVEGIAVDAKGNVYFSESTRVRKVDAGGTITTFAGTGKPGFSGDGGPATSAMLNHPVGIAVDRKGNLYIADLHPQERPSNGRVRKVSPGGKIQTIAGGGKTPYYKDGTRATSAQLCCLVGVAVDLRGNVYFSDHGTLTVGMVSPGGRITRLAGGGDQGALGDGIPATSAYLGRPEGVAVDAKGNVYVADSNNQRVRKVRK